MELEVRPLADLSQDDTLVQLVEDDEPKIVNEANVLQEQRYTIAINRSRRQIRYLQKYKYANLVSFALSMTKSVKVQYPVSYHKAITSGEFAQWSIAMCKKIDSLCKNKI